MVHPGNPATRRPADLNARLWVAGCPEYGTPDRAAISNYNAVMAADIDVIIVRGAGQPVVVVAGGNHVATMLPAASTGGAVDASQHPIEFFTPPE